MSEKPLEDDKDSKCGTLTPSEELVRRGIWPTYRKEPNMDSKKLVCLNLGSGACEIDGYRSVDRKHGLEVYPLDSVVDDGNVDEIYASHILEHFGHGECSSVLNHWVKKLRPGGRIRIAVPNFEWIADHYLKGEPINVQGYVTGGQVDTNDIHASIYDRETLAEIMVNAGLERIGEFASEYKDSSSLEVSLNLQGFKPISDLTKLENVFAVLSAPRFGPVLHFKSAIEAFAPLGIPFKIGQSAYWHQILCELMEEAIEAGAEFIITCDYDSVFSTQDVLELYRLARAYSDADAICAIQMRRGTQFPMFGMVDNNGKPIGTIYKAAMERNLTKINTGHFGLTIIRVSALNEIPKPWMLPIPNDDGRWDEGKIDADVSFWAKWRVAKRKLCMANHVVIGHLEETIKWPGKDLRPIFQTPVDFLNNGIPAEVRR